jgi:hypothetical protein
MEAKPQDEEARGSRGEEKAGVKTHASTTYKLDFLQRCQGVGSRRVVALL